MLCLKPPIVLQLPLLDHTKLGGEQDWDRANLVLSAIGNGYVWQNGEDDPVKVIIANHNKPIEHFPFRSKIIWH
jgi:hypothetical protein